MDMNLHPSSTVPSQLKPHVVHDDYDKTTYNWFLIEYKTYGFARPRSSPRLGDKRKYRDWRSLAKDDTLKDDTSYNTDRGYITSHSVELGCL